MDPHPLANLFKRSNYDEPIASEFCALDYLYEVLLEIRESESVMNYFMKRFTIDLRIKSMIAMILL